MKFHIYALIVVLILVKRNVAKAIKVADFLIEAHLKNAKGMEELVQNWTTDSKGLGLEIASVSRDVASCITVIKELLQEKPKEKKIVKAHS